LFLSGKVLSEFKNNSATTAKALNENKLLLYNNEALALPSQNKKVFRVSDISITNQHYEEFISNAWPSYHFKYIAELLSFNNFELLELAFSKLDVASKKNLTFKSKWTKDEDKFLTNNYDSVRIGVIANTLQRTSRAAQQRAKLLGIHKTNR